MLYFQHNYKTEGSIKYELEKEVTEEAPISSGDIS